MTKHERIPNSAIRTRAGCLGHVFSGFGHLGFIRHWRLRRSLVTAAPAVRGSKTWSAAGAQSAFSLIELVGVLAVVAIMAAVLVPALIRQMDRIAGEQESAALKSFGDALQQSIMRKRYIPSATDWATNIATEAGVDVTNVTTNLRRQPRFFLIDPALQIGTNGGGLPYTQNQTNRVFGSVVTNNAGVVVAPQSPRVMILSSIGRALPTNIVSGVATTNDFNGIWDWNDAGAALPATSFGWTNWPNSEDLKIQRVNLSPLFVHLILTTNVSESGYYSIDSTNLNDRYNVPSPGRDGYFIKNSLLYLYTQGRTNIDSQQILTRDMSYVYDQNVWRSSITGGSFLAGSLDLGSIVDKYLDAFSNPNAQYTTNQQFLVVSNMIAYMTAYTNWAAAGFPHKVGNNPTPPAYQTVDDAQANMMIAVQGEYINNSGYTPTPVPCTP
jgi:type II secretory pathway pseudopilin PulG